MTSVTVYCGADKNPAFSPKMYELGQVLAQKFDLVRYGGGLGDQTMMGELAKGVLDAGGALEGIISSDYWPNEPNFPKGMTAVKVANEAERNEITLSSDALIIAPGQIGTLYEGMASLAFNRARIKRDEAVKPAFLLSLDGYFNKLSGFIDTMFETFNEPVKDRGKYLKIVGDLNELKAAL